MNIYLEVWQCFMKHEILTTLISIKIRILNEVPIENIEKSIVGKFGSVSRNMKYLQH